MMNEIQVIGFISMVLAVIGAILNARKLRFCFIVWFCANSFCAYVHASVPVWGMFIRDIIFSIICVYGWFNWKEKQKEKELDESKEDYPKMKYEREMAKRPGD